MADGPEGAPPSFAPTRCDSVASWLEDDVFTGIETLSEAAHYLSTPAHRMTRPTTPAPWARSRPGTAGVVRRAWHSAPETIGDEVKSPSAAVPPPASFLSRAFSGGLTSRVSFGGMSGGHRRTPRSSGAGGHSHPNDHVITLSADAASLAPAVEAAAAALAGHADDDDKRSSASGRRSHCATRCAACAPLGRVTAPIVRVAWIVLSPVWRLLVLFEKLLPVPAIISLAGIAVGCCPPLKRLFFGPKAPLEFVAHSLHTVAGATGEWWLVWVCVRQSERAKTITQPSFPPLILQFPSCP